MFDLLRNLGRSAEEKQQEALNAYLDGELAPPEREQFEQQLALDPALREELDEMQFWQQEMRSLPRRRVPHNFTLDPALYGRPQRQPLGAVYPVLRGATAVAALFLVIALAANVFTSSFTAPMAQEASSVAMIETAVEEAAPAEMPQMEMEMDEDTAAEEFILEEPAEMEAEEPPPAADEAALLPQKTRDISPALEPIIETTAETLAGAAPAAPARDAAVAAPEEEMIETMPLPRTVPDTAQAADDEPLPPATPSFFESGGLNLFIIGLGLLFVILVVLTFVARGQR